MMISYKISEVVCVLSKANESKGWIGLFLFQAFEKLYLFMYSFHSFKKCSTTLKFYRAIKYRLLTLILCSFNSSRILSNPPLLSHLTFLPYVRKP